MTSSARSFADAEKDAVVFKALGNAVRLQIVWFVAASPAGQVSAGEVVERFDLSQPTISHHLRVLREAGVLTTVKRSTFVYYRFAPQLVQTVAAVLPSKAAVAPPSDGSMAARSDAPTGDASPTRRRRPAPGAQSAAGHGSISAAAGDRTAPGADLPTPASTAPAGAGGAPAGADESAAKAKKKKAKKPKKDKKSKK